MRILIVESHLSGGRWILCSVINNEFLCMLYALFVTNVEFMSLWCA
jgi:hypothetical protein